MKIESLTHLKSKKSKQQVLFVDDEIKIRKGVHRLFQHYHVPWIYHLAESVDEALTILNEQEIDAVISDIRMPNRDGLDLLNTLRSNPSWSDLPVIILTGIANQGLITKALDMGATDLLNKPIAPDDLLARIRSALHIKQCHDIIKIQNIHFEEFVSQRFDAIEALRLDAIWKLGNAAEFRGNFTNNHVVRIGHYSKTVAEGLGMDKEFVDTIFLASPLHDIGKIGIPEIVLFKSTSFTNSELKILKNHCRIGQELLASDTFSLAQKIRSIGVKNEKQANKECNNFLKMASDIAGYHHEQWNGMGYPKGKKLNEIPLPARVVSICDAFDEFRNSNVTNTGLNLGETLTIMRKDNMIKFDPDIFRVFEQNLSIFQDIHYQYRDSGDKEKFGGASSLHVTV